MTNKERIVIIDNMLEICQNYDGLCATYSKCCEERKESMKQTFPAITFFARLCDAKSTSSFHYWWQPGLHKPRIVTLKLLRLWYKLKIIL